MTGGDTPGTSRDSDRLNLAAERQFANGFSELAGAAAFADDPKNLRRIHDLNSGQYCNPVPTENFGQERHRRSQDRNLTRIPLSALRRRLLLKAES